MVLQKPLRMCFLITIITFLLCISEIEKVVGDDVMTKSFYEGESEPLQEERIKKPFCNAFTGCGRKRADDSLGSLLDYNIESDIENLDRRIPMNVRLWIALQKARSSKKLKDWSSSFRQFGHPFFNYRRKRCVSEDYLC